MKPLLTEVHPLDNYRLHIAFDNGVEGIVDLSDFVGKGVFEKWLDLENFRKVKKGDFNAVVWEHDIDMCGDSLYMRLTGKNDDQVFQTESIISH